MMLRYVLPVCSFFLIPALSVAEEKTGPVRVMPAPPVGAGDLANVTLGLIVVLGLIFALAWLYRRYGNVASFNRSNIQILGGVSLGARERAVLLEVEGEQILVGVTPNQITRLHVLKTPSSAPDATEDKASVIQADNIENFASKLKQEQQFSGEVKS